MLRLDSCGTYGQVQICSIYPVIHFYTFAADDDHWKILISPGVMRRIISLSSTHLFIFIFIKLMMANN